AVGLRERPAVRDPFQSLREPGIRIDVIHLALCKSVPMVAQVRPPPRDPREERIILVIVCSLIARSTIFESISIRPSISKRSKAMRLDVAQRIASVSWDLPGQARQLLLPEIEERRHDGGGPFLARLHSGCRILAADVGLDLPEPRHRHRGLHHQLRTLVDVQFVEPPPDVGKAGGQPFPHWRPPAWRTDYRRHSRRPAECLQSPPARS